MPEISLKTMNNNLELRSKSLAEQNFNDSGNIVEAHYTNNMKVKRPKINPDTIQIAVPEQKAIFSDKEASKKLKQLNTDIYIGQRKEKANHEFNFRTYFKIIVAFIAAAASIAGVREIIRFFKK